MPTTRLLCEFSPDDTRTVRAIADAVETRTGVAPFNDETWVGIGGHSVLGDRGLLVTTDDGRAVAYAHLSHHHLTEWSLEIASLDADDALGAALLRDAVEVVAADGGGHVTWWVHGARSADDLVAQEGGFAVERDLLQLRVPLPPARAAVWPDGVTVRAFEPGRDDDAWLAVNNRAFAGHPEQGGWTLDNLHSRQAEPWFDPSGFLVAFDAEGMAGFCWTKVHEPDPPREPDALGEIYVIGADPRWHGRGLGRALTTAGLESLAARGIRTGMLYVDGDNDAAVGLYRALGFVDHRRDRAFGRDVAATVTT